MKLYKYQEEVLNKARSKLAKYKMVYLALEMRLGKSVISLELSKNYSNIVFVTTKSAIPGIIETAEKMNISMDNITLINYESTHKLDIKKYDLMIVDEAHKISKYPKPAIAYKNLKKLIHENIHVIYLSGTPSIESNSQMFHQLALSPHHSFSKFRNFYAWHKTFGIDNFVRRYGGVLAKDYSLTIDFSDRYSPIMIRMTREEAEFIQHDVSVKLINIDVPESTRRIYDTVNRDGIYISDDMIINTEGMITTKLIKLQQITGGTVIGDNNTYRVDTGKLNYLSTLKDKRIAIYYKYIEEKERINDYLDKIDFTHEPKVLNIDSNNTGVDLSDLDEMIIYSLTFSGSNYSQVLSRMANMKRKDEIIVKILIAKDTIDRDIYDAVSTKQNFNSKFLRRKK